MPLISAVSPVYNSEECMAELCNRLDRALSKLTDDYEIILVDDGSKDKSWEAINEQASLNKRVHSFKLTRNYGQHYAITAGLNIAQGDWVVVLDCDLQDPPEQIEVLYKKALEGNPHVVAIFESRTESYLRQKVSKLFWRSLSWLAGNKFDSRIGNFRIMSRAVVEDFKKYKEQLRFLGGILSLSGHSPAYVEMAREKRFAGKTSYNFAKLFSASMDIIMAYSYKPLKISIALGFFISLASFIAGVAVLFLALIRNISVPGWASVMVSLYFIGGVIIFNLGLIGYYIGRTFDETKRRPLYLFDKVVSTKYTLEQIK